MSEPEWHGPLFDPPHVRHAVEEPIKIEQPPAVEVHPAAPPAPAEPPAAPDDPRLAAEVWRQVGAIDAPATDPPPGDSPGVAQLGLALYLLQSLHFQGKPGHEHLIRDEHELPDAEPDESDPPRGE